MRRLKEGSFTVEAALVVSLILSLTAALILMMFYLHDRAVLYETALLEGGEILHMVQEPVTENGKLEETKLKEQHFPGLRTYRESVNVTSCEERFRERAEERLLLTELGEVSLALEDRELTLSFSGRFLLPLGGVTGEVLADILTFSESVHVSSGMSREELVRLSRSLKGR